MERVRGPCSSLCRCRDKWELGQHCSSFILTYYKVIRTSKPAAAAKGSKKQNVNFQSNSSSSHCVWELSTATIMYHLYHVLRMTVLKCILPPRYIVGWIYVIYASVRNRKTHFEILAFFCQFNEKYQEPVLFSFEFPTLFWRSSFEIPNSYGYFSIKSDF